MVNASVPQKSQEPGHAYGLGYMPFLDGMRGIAIIMVLWYHATGPLFRGGFIGVSIFFVLSGFLITALLIQEYQIHQRLYLTQFYMRRALRLLPPLAVLLIAYIAACSYIGQDMQKVVRDALIVFFYGANWARAFDKDLAYPLAHTWSLAVEEQFYILWPLIFVILKGVGLSLRGIGIVTLIAAIASALLAAVWHHQDVSDMRLYNGLDTASSGLLLGCALAFAVAHRPPSAWATPKKLHLASIACAVFLMVIAFTARWNSSFMFYAGYFLVAVATVVIITAMCAAPANPLRKLMEFPWLVKLGRVSYGLYLWHFPIYYLINVLIDANGIGIRWPIKLIVGGGISLAITVLSYRYVEEPVLSLKSLFHAPQKTIAAQPESTGVDLPESVLPSHHRVGPSSL